MRKIGYYWVRFPWGWEPAEWNGVTWVTMGCDTDICDDRLLEIDERPLVRQCGVPGSESDERV